MTRVSLVVMMLTVVYNESKFVTDHDDYEKMLAENAVPFDICEFGSKIKMCEKINLQREFLKKIDYIRDYPDGEYFSPENIRDYFEYDGKENERVESIPVDEKRGRSYADVMKQITSCPTKRDMHFFGNDFYPRLVSVETCNQTSNQPIRKCSEGWNCQPVIRKMKVLFKDKSKISAAVDLPEELNNCWRLTEQEVPDGCECSRKF
ncbi:hypothetical protein Bhyg_04650 [Pseudolycoriella hygida]|uniref:Spaetzle domain-containing protein n=1 Tax=Pseudolycoriella hygida TaxID=35572 RepID=A0A9Q0SA73_9DIPT|nr:hypothetical protein Bhyg_04650 [Pseudolycoriella hygida]